MNGVPFIWLLDTNIFSDLIRHPQGMVAERIGHIGEERVCTSIVVAGELRYGAAKLGSKKLADRIDLVLSALEVLPLESPMDQEYAQLRHYLTRQGTSIGPNDLLIAAQALALDLGVVTVNV